MLDLLYVGITIVFFALGAAYVVGCDRLAPLARASAPTGAASAKASAPKGAS